MKNSEKYKTVQERIEAFRYFCEHHANNGCSECALKEHTCSDTYPMECFAYWLDLEVEEEKPLPCPFCGSEKIELKLIEDASDGYMSQPQIYCSHCGATLGLDWEHTSSFDGGMTDDQKEKLLKMWNTRVSSKVTNEKDMNK